MAVPKAARLLEAERFGPTTRRLVFEVEAPPLDFIGGQYLIFDPGIRLPDGRAAKRAYSILSSDEAQTRFEIAVRRIENGPGSGRLHEMAPGESMSFSGPWGKFLPLEDASPTLVVATDTGITAALGLLRGARFAPRLAATRLVWLVSSEDYFLPFSFVRAALPAALGEFRIEPPSAAGLLDVSSFARIYLAGDGDAIYPISARARDEGLDESRIVLEPFFNNPLKKAPSAQGAR